MNPVDVDAAPPPQSALLPSISARSALAMPVTQSVPDQACTATISAACFAMAEQVAPLFATPKIKSIEN